MHHPHIFEKPMRFTIVDEDENNKEYIGLCYITNLTPAKRPVYQSIGHFPRVFPKPGQRQKQIPSVRYVDGG